MSSSFLSQQEIEKLIHRLNPDVTDEVKRETDCAESEPKEIVAVPEQEVERVEFPEFKTAQDGVKNREVSFFQSVPVTLNMELGSATLTVREILTLQKDSVITLDKLAGENASLYVNSKSLATGEVVVINDNFGFRVAEVGEKSTNSAERE